MILRLLSRISHLATLLQMRRGPAERWSLEEASAASLNVLEVADGYAGFVRGRMPVRCFAPLRLPLR